MRELSRDVHVIGVNGLIFADLLLVPLLTAVWEAVFWKPISKKD